MPGVVGQALARADDALGALLESSVVRHHHRRLGRLGHHDDLTAPGGVDGWVPTRAVRSGNTVEVLVDGEDALAAIAAAIPRARSHVHVAGWHLNPQFRPERAPGSPTIRDLLAAAATRVDVRVLLWAGPPAPAFRPTRRMMTRVRDELQTDTGIRCCLDARERTLHCHHEKMVVVDDEVAFVGGIDLSDLAADRWDETRHRPRPSLGWHDAATRLTGPIVADVAEHFRDRWQECAHEQLPEVRQPEPTGHVDVQLLRTLPERTYRFLPNGEFSILRAYVQALSAAREFIYLENQFLWSPEIVHLLADKLRHPPTPSFRLVLVLPARPSSGRDTTRGQLGYLLEADRGAGRILATTLQSHDDGRHGGVYVHAKVAVVDDRWLTLGSANLNEHSLFNDTEVNLAVTDPDLVRRTRLRLWSEHLERPEAEVAGDPADVVDRLWRPVAQEQARRARQGLPPTHRVIELPAISRRTERLLGPLRGLLVDG